MGQRGLRVAYAFDGGALFGRAVRPLLPGGTGAWPLSYGGLRRRRIAMDAPAGPIVGTDCTEIDCVRHLLPAGLLARAQSRALALGIGADEVLIADGILGERQYAEALAKALGVAFEPLDRHMPPRCVLAPESLLLTPQGDLLPLSSPDGPLWVIAPRGVRIRRIIALFRARPELRRCVRLTTPGRIDGFVQRYAAAALAERSSEKLKTAQPAFSAAHRTFPAHTLALLVLAGMAAALAPREVLLGLLQVLAGAVFLAWSAFRIWAMLGGAERARRAPPQCDSRLPTYTVIVALYREAASLPGLIEALDALDYPVEKLDIKLVLESDDAQTRAALGRMALGPAYEIILAPAAGPRTKPKALNAALPFARGEFTVIFDAEDCPEPDQLRRAYEAFLTADCRVACVQARLTIDNTEDSWLAALFTAEYAGLFDVLLPGLVRRRLPIPLGGSSNHFRTGVLRHVGAWDPYNVTEDADLGIRLARLGYLVSVCGSTTYEEAPATVALWLRQRSRWFKGWMQTWIVHMRQPVRLLRDLGPAGFASFQLLTVGTVLAALLQPIVLFALIRDAVAAGGWPESAIGWLSAVTLALGYATSMALALLGLARRRLLSFRLLVRMPLMVLHWALLSAAAWRAVYLLLLRPHDWEKTEHGLARNSRRGAGVPPSSAQPRLGFKDSAAGRPRRLRAAA